MKKTISLLFLIAGLNFNAQILTQLFNEPVVGDSDKTHPIDTTVLTGSMPINITGSTSVWNFSNLSIGSTVIPTSYESTVSVPSATDYVGSTVVQKQGTLFTFIKSVKTPSTQTEVLGFYSTTLSLTFTNTAIAAKYPVNFGNSFTDNIAGKFTSPFGNGTCSGSITTTADGTGTIILPNGLVLTNILRVKSFQNIALTLNFIPIGTVKQTIYNFYHGSQKFPILSVNYQDLNLAGTPNKTGFVTGNARSVLAGISEANAENYEIRFYPNPVKNTLHIELDPANKPESIKVYNELLQLVYSSPYQESLDINGLTKGWYIVQIKTSKGLITRKIIKE